MKEEAQSNALEIGSMLEEFKILQILGAGGFGITYKVLDTHLDTPMVIKEYMPSQFASRSNKTTVTYTSQDKETFEWGLERFIEEAKLLKKFDHISVVKSERLIKANNTAYFVMKFFEGETLKSYLNKHKNRLFTKEEILFVMMPIIEALKAVHAEGFLHRDVAPDNIFLRVSKPPMLIDFGASRNALGVKSQTISTIIKAGYSPVEQYTSKSKQDETTDLYAVSAVLYEMITNTTPPESTYRQTEVFNDDHDPIEDIVNNYKDRFELSFLETIARGLSIRQKDRIQTIKEFQEGLVKEDAVERDGNNALPIGYMLNEFEILSVLGQGGFGITYKVSNTKLNKYMVIKEYMPDYLSLSKDEFQYGLEVFKNEAKDLSQFNHPNILNICRMFEANDTAYTVMDYLDCETLEEYLNNNINKKFTQKELLSIITPILKGLKVIHDKGIFHCDIIPYNIFLRPSNFCLLMRFEKTNKNIIDLESFHRDITLRICYYSPTEMYTSKGIINASTDVYYLSAVIFEMITGQKPPESTRRQISIFEDEDDPLEDITKNSEYRSRFSPSFLETVKKGLEIRQKDRVQSVEEFEEGLVKEDAVERDNNNALPIGYMLNEFEILSVLGVGSFKITYKVLNTNINKFMVLSEYMSSYLSQDYFKIGLDIFKEEAEKLLQFNHPDIIKAFKVFEANNTAYVVMDYLDGETLEEYLNDNINKKFTQKEVLSIITPILKGLKVVHKKGYLHKDIAPENIFLYQNKHSILMMELVDTKYKIFSFSDSRSYSPLEFYHKGYLPTEQYILKGIVDTTTDIYSISAVIYEMITGKKPPRSDYRQTAIFDNEDDPIEDITKNSEYQSRFSPSFLETVKKGLEIRKKDRVQSIGEFQRRLKFEPSKEHKNQIEDPTIPPPSISKSSGKNKFLEFLEEWLVTIIFLLTVIVTPIVGGLYLLFSASSSENIFFGIALIVIPISLIIYILRDN